MSAVSIETRVQSEDSVLKIVRMRSTSTFNGKFVNFTVNQSALLTGLGRGSLSGSTGSISSPREQMSALLRQSDPASIVTVAFDYVGIDMENVRFI
ncbi:MAG TPA: hypothetical protein VHM70_09605 [Polyangiaceae bacterium]|jgi:hypothetical protein|nr:hypothetical protein [Polyangiaceae bacterium]